MPGLWLPHRRIILPGDPDFSLPPLRLSGSITFVQSALNRTTSGTTVTVSKPTGTADGDFVIISAHSAAAITAPVLTGWNIIQPGANNRLKLFWKIASSEPASWSPSWTGSTAVIVAAMTFRGTTSSPIIASSTSETNLGSDVYTAAALSFGAQDYVQLAIAAHASPNGVVVPTGFTAFPINTIHSANSVQAQCGYKSVLNTSGAGSITFDWTQGGVTTVWNGALGVMTYDATFAAVLGC